MLAYWTPFAGATGITYGHVCVWIFHDWVLVIDDASKGYDGPGTARLD
jgi:hypothetical protein